MKTLSLTILTLIFSFSVFATNPEIEESKSVEVTKKEVNNLELDLFSEKIDAPLIENEKIKIIILNENFRKVREEVVDSMKEVNSRSTLVPVIYRAEFITSMDNVSYYMLQ